jgi:hypothetical protein
VQTDPLAVESLGVRKLNQKMFGCVFNALIHGDILIFTSSKIISDEIDLISFGMLVPRVSILDQL